LILLSFFNGIQAESKQKGSIAHYCSTAISALIFRAARALLRTRLFPLTWPGQLCREFVPVHGGVAGAGIHADTRQGFKTPICFGRWHFFQRKARLATNQPGERATWPR
jgi:hypothetical protein